MKPIDPANLFNPGEEIVGIPRWWRGFVFRVLSGRQLSIYLYLVSLMGKAGVCSPTMERIAQAVGLLSATMVYDSINVLEELGFLLRWRGDGAGSRRNVYQRPSSAYTVLRLLRLGRIDAGLRAPADPDAADDVLRDGLRMLLGDRYSAYADAQTSEKPGMLIALLEERIAGKSVHGLDELDVS